MPGGFNPDDYVPVAERLVAFYEKYPEGSVQSDIIELDDKRVVMRATVYRTPQDERPSVAHSALGIPGTTGFTRGSEIENAETSAVGRAIAMMGFEVKRGVASREEVAGKQVDRSNAGGLVNDEPLEPTHANGLIGTVEVGKAPVDMELRQTPDGAAWGFKLKNGRKSYQVLAIGPLANAAALVATDIVGTRVQVWGSIDLVPWDKAGKAMPPFARVKLEKLKTDDWELPLSPLRDHDDYHKDSPTLEEAEAIAPGQESFDLAESQRIDAEEAAATA